MSPQGDDNPEAKSSPRPIRRKPVNAERLLRVLNQRLESSVSKPKATMFVWAPIPEPYRAMGSLEFCKILLQEAKVAVSPGIGFGAYGDDHVRFGLIENEHRTRQALRGIRNMLKQPAQHNADGPDGLVKTANEEIEV
jgi:aspartate/methionine/tyrosine aminotransferase